MANSTNDRRTAQRTVQRTVKTGYRLDTLSERYLIRFHSAFTLAWIVAVVLRNLAVLASGSASSGEALYASHLLLLRVDEFLVVPATAGVLVTTFLISRLTERGFRWISLSWMVTAGLVVLNTVFLGPWIIRLLGIVQAQGLSATSDPSYQAYHAMLFALGSVQILVLLAQAAIVHLKPCPIVQYRGASAWRLLLGQLADELGPYAKRTGRAIPPICNM